MVALHNGTVHFIFEGRVAKLFQKKIIARNQTRQRKTLQKVKAFRSTNKF